MGQFILAVCSADSKDKPPLLYKDRDYKSLLQILEDRDYKSLLQKTGDIISMIIYQDDYIEVHCLDEKGAGGAHHQYSVVVKEIDPEKGGQLELGDIRFQKGDIAENGVNGLTNEALLAIIEHRINCFQSGPFPSHYNAAALHGILFSNACLHSRTEERRTRGVEGKNVE